MTFAPTNRSITRRDVTFTICDDREEEDFCRNVIAFVVSRPREMSLFASGATFESRAVAKNRRANLLSVSGNNVAIDKNGF